jgi:transcriptional regulator with XRE-family HTH domain
MTAMKTTAKTERAAFSPAAFLDAIREADMTPGQLAEELGAAPSTVAKWLAGMATPRPAMLKQAARILGVEPGDLLQEES